MEIIYLWITVAVLLPAVSADRIFTVLNNCSYTVWPATFTDLSVGTAVPYGSPDLSGWEAAPGTSKTFNVPDNWRAGRIWGRRGCDFSVDPGPNSCLTGGCNGGLACDSLTGTGVPPASLAEWTLDGTNDWYDVSLVDGFNIPMRIDTNVGCPIAECAVDLNLECPAENQGPKDIIGTNVGCKSDCLVDSNPADSPSCCSGSHSLPETCPPSGVKNYAFFKDRCPQSYVYAYDESSQTALWTCPTTNKANYALTFCPATE